MGALGVKVGGLAVEEERGSGDEFWRERVERERWHCGNWRRKNKKKKREEV